MRKRAKVDSNQTAIVDALRKAGAFVQSMAAIGRGCPDLLAGYRGQTYILELKDGSKVPSARRLTEDQLRWHAQWTGGPLMVVESADDALKAIGATS